jgi:hypothetical protein
MRLLLHAAEATISCLIAFGQSTNRLIATLYPVCIVRVFPLSLLSFLLPMT